MTALYIILAILMLCVIITSHEFGHYFAGRRLGIAITEFAIGMGPAIYKKEKQVKIKGTNETETIKYSLRAIPVGGFCAFVGEDDNSDNPRAMNNMPPWKRIITVGAGPFMNFFTAFVIAVILISTGVIPNTYKTEVKPEVSALIEGMPAEEAGLKPGDVILSIDGEEISYNGEGAAKLKEYLAALPEGAGVNVGIKRGNEQDGYETLELAVYPVRDASSGQVLMGINMPTYYEEYDCNVITAVPEAITFMWNTAKTTVNVLIGLIRTLLTGGRIQQGTVSGVVGVVSTVSDDMRWGFSETFGMGLQVIVFYIMAISLSLGIMNSLPFPALDGGRMVMLLIEWITGKHLNRRVEGYINAAGLAALLILMLIITYSDIKSLVR
ncbi:MAG: site-2 protease family protein [Clostridia bacterium]|nr:site-2 protease family protein [Clostridia bacterium]